MLDQFNVLASSKGFATWEGHFAAMIDDDNRPVRRGDSLSHRKSDGEADAHDDRARGPHDENRDGHQARLPRDPATGGEDWPTAGCDERKMTGWPRCESMLDLSLNLETLDRRVLALSLLQGDMKPTGRGVLFSSHVRRDWADTE
ncbi:MAG: hypothetical protein SFY96_04750 [Planctomycetota bacterium]|nr:hypothetical protein [Planctomycetota bacterium]